MSTRSPTVSLATAIAGGLAYGILVAWLEPRWTDWRFAPLALAPIAIGIGAGLLSNSLRVRAARLLVLASEIFLAVVSGSVLEWYTLLCAQQVATSREHGPPNWKWFWLGTHVVVTTAYAVWASRRVNRWGRPAATSTHSSKMVVDDEVAHIGRRRDVVGLARNAPTVALALSGGGVRSASFAMGVLIALTREGFHRRIDYLSTVSGGGWAGAGWLRSWVAHDSASTGIESLNKRLSKSIDYLGLKKSWWLRDARRFPQLALVSSLPFREIFSGLVITSGSLSFLCISAAAGLVFVALLTLLPTAQMLSFTDDLRWVLGADVGGYAHALYKGERLVAAGRVMSAFPEAVTSPWVVLSFLQLGLIAIWLLSLVVERWRTGVEIEARNAMLAFFTPWAYALAAMLILQGRAFVTIVPFGALCAAAVLAFFAWRGLSLPGGSRGRLFFVVVTAVFTMSGMFVTYESAALARVVDDLTAGWYVPLLEVVLAPGDLLMDALGSDPLCVDELSWDRRGISEYEVPAGVFGIRRTGECSSSFGVFGLVMALASTAALALAIRLRRNDLSILRWWRDAIAGTFLSDSVGVSLAEHVDVMAKGGPLHLIQGAVNTPYWDQTDWILNAGPFEMTPRFVGSPSLGYAETATHWNDGLSHAVAVSAAAVSGQAGPTIPTLAGAVTSVLGLQLGWWVRNPAWGPAATTQGSALMMLIREAMGSNTTEDEVLFLSDGGHYENLGLVRLVERGVDLVIVSDATYDPDYRFEDLLSALRILRRQGYRIERARMGGVFVSPSVAWHENVPTTDPTVELTIVHPRGPKRTRVVVIKACVPRAAGKAVGEPHAPQDPTSDQYFSVLRYQLYRDLGDQVTGAALDSLRATLSQVDADLAFVDREVSKVQPQDVV